MTRWESPSPGRRSATCGPIAHSVAVARERANDAADTCSSRVLSRADRELVASGHQQDVLGDRVDYAELDVELRSVREGGQVSEEVRPAVSPFVRVMPLGLV